MTKKEQRIKKLTEYLQRLGAGEELEEVRKDFVKEFSDVQASEIMEAEQELMKQGTPLEEVQRLCDVHAALFHGVTPEEEMRRLEFALHILNKHYPDIPVSVDTFRAGIARRCVEEYGVAIINDISGGELDADMFQTVADLKVPYIMMHMRGTPQTMQRHTDYPDMMEEIMLYFSRKVRRLRLLGVNDIILDPGFGFSKTLEQNYQLMSHLKEFSIFELPLLVGVSRKSMIYKLLGGTPADSLNGTTVLNTFALLNGANILRVHDVREAVEAIRVIGQMTNK